MKLFAIMEYDLSDEKKIVGLLEIEKNIENIEGSPLLLRLKELTKYDEFYKVKILEHAAEPIGTIYTIVPDLHFPNDNRYKYVYLGQC